MKNTIFLAIAALFFSASVSAQSTVDSIAAKYKLLPMPEPLTVEKTFPILGAYTLNSPATAATEATTVAAADSAVSVSAPSLTVTLDSASKGIVWIEGLPQGRIKAYLRQSPATYRILSQKTESGKQISEGTAILDTATKTLNIALGAPYNEADPASIFAFSNAAVTDAETGENKVEIKTKTKTSKTKAKVTYYTATKVQQATMVDDQEAVDQQVDQKTADEEKKEEVKKEDEKKEEVKKEEVKQTEDEKQ
jgi:hypothetical protein